MIAPVRPVIPIVMLVIGTRPSVQVFGIDAQPIMAVVANDIIISNHLPARGAVDEALCGELLPVEPHILTVVVSVTTQSSGVGVASRTKRLAKTSASTAWFSRMSIQRRS